MTMVSKKAPHWSSPALINGERGNLSSEDLAGSWYVLGSSLLERRATPVMLIRLGLPTQKPSLRVGQRTQSWLTTPGE